jgi:hypothetical protein
MAQLRLQRPVTEIVRSAEAVKQQQAGVGWGWSVRSWGCYHWTPLAHFRFHELGPTSMVINMANDSWNVRVARLSNGFAVVHGLDAGYDAHVFLKMAGDGVKMTGSGVRSELRPRTEGLSGALNGKVAVVLVALDSFAQNLAGGRILGLVKGSALGLVPLVVDEVAKRAAVVI